MAVTDKERTSLANLVTRQTHGHSRILVGLFSDIVRLYARAHVRTDTMNKTNNLL